MYLILSIASIVSVFPLYYMFCASTNKSVDVIAGKLIPGTYLIENYKALIANQNLGLALWNSFRNATVLTVLCLLICSIAGYGFEIYHDKGKDVVFTILLTAMMIPFAAIMIPMFRMFSTLKMVNTMTAFMLPSIATPFMIMMFRQASRSFPHDIIEAARIDGCSFTKTFFSIILPLLKPIIITVTVFVAMGVWNDFLMSSLFLTKQGTKTLAIAIKTFLTNHTAEYAPMMAGLLLSILPVLAFYLFGQKYIIEGVVAGSVKG